MNGFHSDEDIIQNLKDAGCDAVMIQMFLSDLHSGIQTKGVKLLKQHRCTLLENMHAEQRKIDCLDYFLFMLQKQSQQ